MKTALRTTSALALASLALALVSTPAMAQTPAADPAAASDDSAPGEIVVTAQKRTERLQDVPVAVWALMRWQPIPRPISKARCSWCRP